MDQPKPRKDFSKSDRKVIRDVNTHGWHIRLIHPKDQLPGWAFSIGLYHNFKHPEILIFGLSNPVMHSIINTIGDEVKGGKLFERDNDYADIIEGGRCAFKTVSPVWYPEILGYATWFYNGFDFPVLQCFWPDKQHNFPWDHGFSQELIDSEPLLFIGIRKKPAL